MTKNSTPESPAERRLERLRNADVTPTMQRLAILECLEETPDHPTAELIFERVRKLHPTIARGTVFNTLDALTKAGAILRLTIDPSAARYDADLDPHIHFRCRVCGQLIDFHDQPNRRIENANGHRVETIRTYAYGVCSECLHAETSQQKKAEGNERPPSGKSGSKRRPASDGKTTQPEKAEDSATSPASKNGSRRRSASDGNARQQKKPEPSSASDSTSRREVH